MDVRVVLDVKDINQVVKLHVKINVKHITMLILAVLSVAFSSCASPVDEPEVDVKNPFIETWGQRGTNARVVVHMGALDESGCQAPISIPVRSISFTNGLSLLISDRGNALGSRQINLL